MRQMWIVSFAAFSFSFSSGDLVQVKANGACLGETLLGSDLPRGSASTLLGGIGEKADKISSLSRICTSALSYTGTGAWVEQIMQKRSRQDGKTENNESCTPTTPLVHDTSLLSYY